jgi:hypothetical protein
MAKGVGTDRNRDPEQEDNGARPVLPPVSERNTNKHGEAEHGPQRELHHRLPNPFFWNLLRPLRMRW